MWGLVSFICPMEDTSVAKYEMKYFYSPTAKVRGRQFAKDIFTTLSTH